MKEIKPTTIQRRFEKKKDQVAKTVVSEKRWVLSLLLKTAKLSEGTTVDPDTEKEEAVVTKEGTGEAGKTARPLRDTAKNSTDVEQRKKKHGTEERSQLSEQLRSCFQKSGDTWLEHKELADLTDKQVV